MKLKVDGDSKCIYSKDEQPLKASFSIDVTEEGIEISFKDEQLANVFSPISVTDGGIETLDKEEQFMKV